MKDHSKVGKQDSLSNGLDNLFKPQTTNQVHTMVGALGGTPFCSTANTVGNCTVNITTSPSQLGQTSNVYTTPLTPLLSSSTPLLSSYAQPQLALESLIRSLTPFLGMPSTSGSGYPLKPATIKSNKTLYITKLNNRIKKCSGCGHLFRDVGTVTPEFILGHLERDWYPAQGSQ